MSLHNSFTLETLLSMPDNSADNHRIAKDGPSMKEHLSTNRSLRQSIVVFISARALGHLGFALVSSQACRWRRTHSAVPQSLFAVWLTWLLPSALAEPPPQAEIKKPKRRIRSPRQSMQTTPMPLDGPSQRRTQVPAPLDLTPILATRAVDTQPARHVCFADAQGGPTTLTIAETPAQPIATVQSIHLVEDSSPRPSISALPEIDSAAQESDSSRTSRPSSLQRSSRLQKFKLGFTKPRSESLDRADQNSITSEGALSIVYNTTFNDPYFRFPTTSRNVVLSTWKFCFFVTEKSYISRHDSGRAIKEFTNPTIFSEMFIASKI